MMAHFTKSIMGFSLCYSNNTAGYTETNTNPKYLMIVNYHHIFKWYDVSKGYWK